MRKSRITTANLIRPDFSDAYELYVGTSTGTFKRFDVNSSDNSHAQQQLQAVQALTPDSRISALGWGSSDQTEILIGRRNGFVKVFDCRENTFTSNVKMIEGPIVGVCRYDGTIISGLANGQIQIGSATLATGDSMSCMRQCLVDSSLVASGGKKSRNCLKVWDLTEQKCIFKAKNVRHDELQLERSVWETSIAFLEKNTLSTCSRHGYIRYYDTRQQRRPVLEYREPNEGQTFSCMAQYDKTVFVGTAMGKMFAFDTRLLKSVLHTYKGFTGSVTDMAIDATGKHIVTSSLDRFVRIHDAEKTAMLYQCYVKSKATCVLLKTGIKKEATTSADAEKTGGAVTETNDEELDDLFDKMPTIQDTMDDAVTLSSEQKKRKLYADRLKRVKKARN